MRPIVNSLKKHFYQWARGAAIIFLGILLALYPNTLDNPTAATLEFWKWTANAVIVIGFIDMIDPRRAARSDEDEQREALLKKLETLEQQISKLNEVIQSSD